MANCIRLIIAACFLILASAASAEDRTAVVETPLNWHLNPFQKNGYSYPNAPNLISKAEREAACDRIDIAFAASGFKMKRDVPYDRDGVTFHVTGYDAEKKVGYVWAMPETLGEGFFGNPAVETEAAKKKFLSAAEAKLLEDRAPQTREFIAVIIPFTHRLGYRIFPFKGETEEEKKYAALLEKAYADDAEKRLAALDTAVTEYVVWVAERRAEEYPAPSNEPRNLFPVARWSLGRDPHYPFGICGVGLFHPLEEKTVKKSLTTWGEEAKLDLSAPFVYTTKSASITITGFDSKKKIGYVWSTPSDDEVTRKKLAALAADAETHGLKIAWISPWDGRFDASEDGGKVALERLDRRLKEFFNWAEKELQQ